MRAFFTLLVIAAAAYLGYLIYLEKNQKPVATPAVAEAAAPTQTPPANPGPTATTKVETPTPKPARKAPAGTLYLVKRVSVTHADGIASHQPGESLRILERRGDGKIKLTDGKWDFVVDQIAVTDDLDVAEAAAKNVQPPVQGQPTDTP